MRTLGTHRIYPDRPLEDPADARLGRGSFAEYLADSLGRMDSTQGVVVGLYGAWGSVQKKQDDAIKVLLQP